MSVRELNKGLQKRSSLAERIQTACAGIASLVKANIRGFERRELQTLAEHGAGDAGRRKQGRKSTGVLNAFVVASAVSRRHLLTSLLSCRIPDPRASPAITARWSRQRHAGRNQCRSKGRA